MKTIQLSNEKARILTAFIAPMWAERALKLAAYSDRLVNNPFRWHGQTPMQLQRRLAEVRRNVAALGDVLTELGAELPKPDRTVFIIPYRSPAPERSRKVYDMIHTSRFSDEKARIVKLICDQIG